MPFWYSEIIDSFIFIKVFIGSLLALFFQAFVDFAASKGVDIIAEIKPVTDVIGWDLPKNQQTFTRGSSRSIRDLFESWKEYFSFVDGPMILDWFILQIQVDQDVYDLLDYVQNAEFVDLVIFIRAQEPVQEVINLQHIHQNFHVKTETPSEELDEHILLEIQVKPQYNIPRFNVFSRYNFEKSFTLPIDTHVFHPRYNVNFNVTLKNFGSQRNIISRFHCNCCCCV